MTNPTPGGGGVLRCSECGKKLARYLSGLYRIRNGSGGAQTVIVVIDCLRCKTSNHIIEAAPENNP